MSSALAIRLYCGAGSWVHQEKISPPLCKPRSYWPVTRPAPFEGTPDIPADNLFHSSAQLGEDRPNRSTRPALWRPCFQCRLSPFTLFPLPHLMYHNSKEVKTAFPIRANFSLEKKPPKNNKTFYQNMVKSCPFLSESWGKKIRRQHFSRFFPVRENKKPEQCKNRWNRSPATSVRCLESST